MWYVGTYTHPFGRREQGLTRRLGIVSAPLWDSTTSTYAGLLTVTDYLNVVRYYNLHADKLKDIDSLILSDLKGQSASSQPGVPRHQS